MLFSQQRFFEYDVGLINGSDLATIYRISSEWYKRLCPRIQYNEIAREFAPGVTQPTNVDKLWNEPATGVKKFGRRFEVHTHVQMSKEDKLLTRYGLVAKRPDLFQFGVNILRDLDLWPEEGDHIIYTGNEFEILKVIILPEHRFGHTTMPIHVTCECKRYQWGDSVQSSDGSGGVKCDDFSHTEA